MTPLPVSDMKLSVSYGRSSMTAWYNATNCSVISPNAVIQCHSTAGMGVALRWRVEIEMKVDGTWISASGVSLTALATYTAPIITQVSCSQDFPSQGSTSRNIVLRGLHFGPVSSAKYPNIVQVKYSKYEATNCKVVSTSSNEPNRIDCASVAGIGKDLGFTVFVGDQQSPKFASSCRYEIPRITRISKTENLTTAGNEKVTLIGTGFGPSTDPDNIVSVKYENSNAKITADRCTVTTDNTHVTCLTRPGTGVGYSWMITAPAFSRR